MEKSYGETSNLVTIIVISMLLTAIAVYAEQSQSASSSGTVTTISSTVNDVRPQSANVTDQGGTIQLSAGSLSMQGSAISTISTGTQNGGNLVIGAMTTQHELLASDDVAQ